MGHKHKVGLYIGRFQPFHKGHKSIVEAALKQCDRLIIGIGSSQETRTKRNPFSYEEREQMILRSFFAEELYSRIIIIPIPDRTEYSDDASWGQYVLDYVWQLCGLRPSINFSGREQCRSTWFDGIDIEEVVIERNIIPFSATELRQALINGNEADFFHMTPSMLWLGYDRMRKIILEVNDNEHKISG